MLVYFFLFLAWDMRELITDIWYTKRHDYYGATVFRWEATCFKDRDTMASFGAEHLRTFFMGNDMKDDVLMQRRRISVQLLLLWENIELL
jgi:hypothetical protein